MTYRYFVDMLEKACKDSRTHEPMISSIQQEEPILLHEFRNVAKLDDIVEGDRITVHFSYGVSGYTGED